MPTIIPADQWDFDPQSLDTGFQPNHGQELTTEAILASMEEVENREEMKTLDSLLKESPFHMKRKICD